MKKKIVIRNFIPIAIICLVTGFFIALLGFFNYKNNVLNIQTTQGQQIINYLGKFYDSFEVSFKAEDAYKLADALKDTSSILKKDEAIYFFYDKEECVMYGADEEINDLADGAMVESGFKEIIVDNVHYVPVDVNDQMCIIAAYDTTSLSTMLQTVIPSYAKWFAISFCILCLILLLIGFLSKKKRAGKTGACILVAVWMIVLSSYLAIFTGVYFFGQFANNQSCISIDIEEDVKNVNETSAEEMVFQLAMIDMLVADSRIDFNYVEAFDEAGNLVISEDDLRKQYLNLNVTYYRDFSNFFSEIKLNDNILDESVDIGERVSFTVNWNYISNCFIAYILQIFMLGSCAIVLILEIYYYEEERMLRYMEKSLQGHSAKIHITSGKAHISRVVLEKARQVASRYNISDRTKLILTVQQVASALVCAVSVVMLRSKLMDQYPVNGGIFITIVIAGEGIISAFAIFMFPKIVGICKTEVGFMRFSALVCIVGSALCYLARNCWLYVAGFIFISLGSALVMSLQYMNIGGEDDITGIMKNIKNLSRGMTVGALVGFVISSVISSIISDRAIFLFGFALFVIMLLLTFGESEDIHTLENINIGKIFDMFKSVDLWVYLILIIIPMGMVEYFIKYRIPLDVSALGLTTALVSFLYYLRMLITLFFKYKAIKNPLQKVNLQVRVIILVLASAAVIVGYCLLPKFIVMIIAIILIAYINTFFDVAVHGTNASINSVNTVENSAFDMVQKGAQKLSSTLASLITQAFGIMSIAFAIAGASLVYLGYYLKRRKK